jgi:hypothetical protein
MQVIKFIVCGYGYFYFPSCASNQTPSNAEQEQLQEQAKL